MVRNAFPSKAVRWNVSAGLLCSLLYVCSLGTSFSEDGAYLAYGLSSSGSDWVQICFLQVVPCKEDTPAGALILPDRLDHVKFSCMSWTHDGRGMFYNRYPPPAQSCDGEPAHLASCPVRLPVWQHCCLLSGRGLALWVYSDDAFFYFIHKVVNCLLVPE